MTTDPTPSRAPRTSPTAPTPLTVVIHDYSGHPGQVQLSRALAGRGHRVTHQHCPSYVTGKGAVEPVADDLASLALDLLMSEAGFHRGSGNPLLWQSS